MNISISPLHFPSTLPCSTFITHSFAGAPSLGWVFNLQPNLNEQYISVKKQVSFPETFSAAYPLPATADHVSMRGTALRASFCMRTACIEDPLQGPVLRASPETSYPFNITEGSFLLASSGLWGSAVGSNPTEIVFLLFACGQLTVLCNLACDGFNG